MMRHLPASKPTGSKYEIFRRSVGLFRPYRMYFGWLVLLIAATSLLNLLPALLIAQIVNEAVNGGDGGRITMLSAISIAMLVAASLLGVLQAYINQTIGQGIMVDGDTGSFMGGADPRRDGYALGW